MLYVALFSLHGLIRPNNLELGRDADTGGQTRYVVELANALAELPNVGKVELFTRLIKAPSVDAQYALPEEPLAHPNAKIIRLPAGPDEYLPKEALWEHMDEYADHVLDWFVHNGQQPDLLHSHYADAGYVVSRLANQTGIPMVHTGHSLGRDKLKRLTSAGLSLEEIEKDYKITQRIEAEELALANADLVITSTTNEREDQYELYDYYNPDTMRVIPPGVDLNLFTSAEKLNREQLAELPTFRNLTKSLVDPNKPIILALARADQRKNSRSLVIAFGKNRALREKANLVLILGNRDDISDLNDGARDVFTELLLLVDKYDLYGSVSLPKHHASHEVPDIYRTVAATNGVFVNPALTEPFGLTLLEAAASGLPIVATSNGGPVDIIENCKNGILVNPLESDDIGDALFTLVNDKEQWNAFRDAGLHGVKKFYSWQAHAKRFAQAISQLVRKTNSIDVSRLPDFKIRKNFSGAIFTGFDQNLAGNKDSLHEFTQIIKANRKRLGFGIATGRTRDSILTEVKKNGIPTPDFLIAGLGSEIYYTKDILLDKQWMKHIDHLWSPSSVWPLMENLPGIRLQENIHQSRFKISYYYDAELAPTVEEINAYLRQNDQAVNITLSLGQYLDITPLRASKGNALRYVAQKWEIPFENILVAGGSGADEDMMRGASLAVIVKNRHREELSNLEEGQSIYFSEQAYSAGIVEAIEHYDFLNQVEKSH
ncbi:MAG TPA: HAD family hydrolase [Marinagarivorans sp.]